MCLGIYMICFQRASEVIFKHGKHKNVNVKTRSKVLIKERADKLSWWWQLWHHYISLWGHERKNRRMPLESRSYYYSRQWAVKYKLNYDFCLSPWYLIMHQMHFSCSFNCLLCQLTKHSLPNVWLSSISRGDRWSTHI